MPAVVLCHGYPSTGTAATAPETMPELADRIATEMGWAALAFAYRGCGESEGQFSLGGWLDDIATAVAHVDGAVRPLGIWLAGFGTGGSLAVCAAAADPRVQGVAALGAPGRLRRLGVAPPPPARARARGRASSPTRRSRRRSTPGRASSRRSGPSPASGRYAPRPLLVIHGSEDEVVPPFDARVLADAHGSAELRLINGAGHALRHDPRTVAVLLGWLDRQRHALHR